MHVIAREPARAIRACEREDLPQVAALYESVMRSGRREPPPRLAEYFARTFFDCPWADPEIPSLVYEDRGRIVGFLGSHVRRVRLDGKTLRLVCGGQLVAGAEARGKPVGAMLFRTHLRGPQDATYTDGANQIMRRMWEVSGGEVAPLKTMSWARILKPVRAAGDHLAAHFGRPRLSRRLAPLWKPLDAAALRFGARRFALPERKTRGEPLTVAAVLEHMRAATESLRCHPDYDAAFLAWVFDEMAQMKSRGTLVRTLVRDAEGAFLGWYVYYLQPGVAQVVQIAARRGAHGAVLDELLHHAAENGAAAVAGRLEPQLADALAARKVLYGWSGSALFHARTPALLGVLLSSQCWLGLMDGESWMGHHRESFA